MATAFVKHCAEKKLKMYFMALWPVGPQMVQNTIDKVIRADYPTLVYAARITSASATSPETKPSSESLRRTSASSTPPIRAARRCRTFR